MHFSIRHFHQKHHKCFGVDYQPRLDAPLRNTRRALRFRGTRLLEVIAERADNFCFPYSGNVIYLKAVDYDVRTDGPPPVLCLTLECKVSHARPNTGVRGFAHLCAGYGNI